MLDLASLTVVIKSSKHIGTQSVKYQNYVGIHNRRGMYAMKEVIKNPVMGDIILC